MVPRLEGKENAVLLLLLLLRVFADEASRVIGCGLLCLAHPSLRCPSYALQYLTATTCQAGLPFSVARLAVRGQPFPFTQCHPQKEWCLARRLPTARPRSASRALPLVGRLACDSARLRDVVYRLRPCSLRRNHRAPPIDIDHHHRAPRNDDVSINTHCTIVVVRSRSQEGAG